MDDRDEKLVALHKELAKLTVAVYGFSGAREELSDVVSQLETMRQHGDPIDNLELARIEGRIRSSIEELDRFMGVNIGFYGSFGDLLEGFVQHETEPEA